MAMMDIPKAESIFDRSGLAAVSDTKHPEHQAIFSTLEKVQAAFLSKEHEFRSREYKWPRDPLHNWSRVWEYPYVYHHLARQLESSTNTSRPVVADVGSGVTFFPFSLANLGYEVICTDIDPVCERDLLRAAECVSHSPGAVGFRLIDKATLPFEDEKCDALFCISVLEHIHDFENTLMEMARILKPEGLCLITCDLGLDIDEDSQLDIAPYKKLICGIEKEFRFLWPERTTHPADVLTSRNSPYAVGRKSCSRFLWQLTKQKILKPLLGRKPGCVSPGPEHLAILGLALQKKHHR
jgi:SAM-dependent methyltransferase